MKNVADTAKGSAMTDEHPNHSTPSPAAASSTLETESIGPESVASDASVTAASSAAF